MSRLHASRLSLHFAMAAQKVAFVIAACAELSDESEKEGLQIRMVSQGWPFTGTCELLHR